MFMLGEFVQLTWSNVQMLIPNGNTDILSNLLFDKLRILCAQLKIAQNDVSLTTFSNCLQCVNEGEVQLPVFSFVFAELRVFLLGIHPLLNSLLEARKRQYDRKRRRGPFEHHHQQRLVTIPEQREAERERKRQQRAQMTPEQKESERERRRQQRAQMTPEQVRLVKFPETEENLSEHHPQQRLVTTPEQRESERARKRHQRAQMTPEQKEAERERNRQQRTQMTLEQKEAERERNRQQRTQMTPNREKPNVNTNVTSAHK